MDQDRPRNRELDRQVVEVQRRISSIDREASDRGWSNRLRQGLIHANEDKIAVLEAIQRDQPEFRPADLKREIARLHSEIATARQGIVSDGGPPFGG